MRDIKEYLQANQEVMLDVLAKLVSFNSVEAQDSDYPFGKANAECLDYALALCDSWGMKTANLDYYVGYGEIGKGDQVIGIATHLDIVPAGSGWDSDPFGLVIKDGKAFGRGTSDDKGPAVAALFAMKYLLDNGVDLNKRIRIVFGCNEESGFKCIEKYVAEEGHFDIGIVPDGPFPCCFGEKGIIKVKISTKNNIFKQLSGGVAPNVVPNNCEFTVAADLVDQVVLNEYLKASPIVDFSIVEENGELAVTLGGKAAHASTPQLGVNAITYSLSALVAAGVNDEALKEFNDKINTELHGDSCGIHLKDQYGDLTLNVGLIAVNDGKLEIVFDIRCPFTHHNDEAIAVLEKAFNNWDVEILANSTGLYQPEDSEFVKMLVAAYREVSGSEAKPLTMGGGTYARMVNNTLAFGMSDDEDCHIHDANEYVQVTKLLQGTEIYIKALLQMLKM